MDPAIRRLGLRFRLSRDHAIFILLIGAVVAAIFWIGPDRASPARLQLLALDANGEYTAELTLDSANAVPSRTPGRTVRFPLALGVRNVGASAEQPTALFLSVPAYFRLLDPDGEHVPSRRTPGTPMVRYRVELESTDIEPAVRAVPLEPADTLWLEPALPQYYCRLISEGVPEFEAAPALGPGSISRVEVFYAFDSSSSARQAGLLELTVDPSLLQADPAAPPAVFPTTYYDTAASLPALGRLVKIGERTESCGQPDLPAELYSVLWETEAGGRVFVVYSDGEPRKYLFDLDRNDVIEHEMWDRDGDGRLDASREARFSTPSFLLPIPSEAEWLAGTGRMTSDSAWLSNFYNVAAGPFRFLRSPDDSARAQPGAATGRLATPAPSAPRPSDTTAAPAAADPRMATPGADDADRAGDERAATAERQPDSARDERDRIFGQPVTRPADTPAPPRRIFGMPVIRQQADTTRGDTTRPETIQRDTVRRRN